MFCKKTSPFVFLFGLLFAFFAQAQRNLNLEDRLLIKVSPLALLEPETIVIQGGIEYFFSSKFSIQTELGVNGGIFGIPSGRGKNEDFNLWKSKSELKFHTKNHYWGLELFFVNKAFIRTDDYFFDSNTKIWYNKAHIDFQVLGSGLKFGKQQFISQNLLLDSFIGVGFRSRNREINLLELSPVQEVEEEYFLSSDRYRFNGKDYIPHITIGIKVGVLPLGG
ncbi:DUF3575 domain-containing protein [Algoriphagus halophytocola]|uniref:DUF3575 domain-containing protein n=1 Tax=Algoriphagus halophytocola TaxID=2991499 RepID=A0ABY6MF99_9BACT|nr:MULTISPECIES: DUF3575 domain-containing protein [unclassified Algoriphagus]UZD21011.1 DUF3575 domain-containing protein [Algoriphagus sp. TR-M5]WBL42177.1 DUF3575 domain-containing protein [Algoriphagus sp. TR-M9]